jgi:transcriptional regulator with XRE-family HTH domain
MPSTIAARFGYRIAAGRKRRGWTIAELAAKSGVERGVINHLEHGHRGCRLDSAVLLAAALEITLDGLAEPCKWCGDKPPPGFTCNACGTNGEEPQP